MNIVKFIILALIILSNVQSFAQPKRTDDYLILVHKKSGAVGYKDKAGKMIIPFGKYDAAFTDTLRKFAIVVEKNNIVGIDRNQKILFNVFQYDNGPDEISEGLFRIIENGKIGYADASGIIRIKPTYQCANPFENGRAKVSLNCTTKKDGEHSTWESDNWIYINKKGVRVNKMIL